VGSVVVLVLGLGGTKLTKGKCQWVVSAVFSRRENSRRELPLT